MECDRRSFSRGPRPEENQIGSHATAERASENICETGDISECTSVYRDSSSECNCRGNRNACRIGDKASGKRDSRCERDTCGNSNTAGFGDKARGQRRSNCNRDTGDNRNNYSCRQRSRDGVCVASCAPDSSIAHGFCLTGNVQFTVGDGHAADNSRRDCASVNAASDGIRFAFSHATIAFDHRKAASVGNNFADGDAYHADFSGHGAAFTHTGASRRTKSFDPEFGRAESGSATQARRNAQSQSAGK